MTSTKPLSYLIVCCRYIGDVLVTTPLALSIKTAQPDAVVDYLVFEGTEGVLAKNPHVDQVITMPQGSKDVFLAFSLWNRYDYAIAAGPSDRNVIFSFIAGRTRAGLDYGYPRDFWKRFLLRHFVFYDDSRHAVRNLLTTLDPLGIVPVPRMAMGFDQEDVSFVTKELPTGRFVVMHPYSRNRCKYWPAEKWRHLAQAVTEHLGVSVIFTITPAAEDRNVLKEILADAPSGVSALPEPFTFNQLAAFLSYANVYVGIDTVVTHIAATVGAPTVALYGPTWTRYWAPWPVGNFGISPFAHNKGIQRVGNVSVVQKDWECVPCNKESCAISTRNRMECLEELSVDDVFEAVRLSMNVQAS